METRQRAEQIDDLPVWKGEKYINICMGGGLNPERMRFLL